MNSFFYHFTSIVLSFLVVACGGSIQSRLDTAQSISQRTLLLPETITAAPFDITIYKRIQNPGMPASVYIEGDGLAWMDRSTPSFDPTPTNPMGFRLAALDKGGNVIYLARPCQYTKMSTRGKPCPQKYWTSHRFAPEVLDSMNAVLDILKSRHHISEFDLVGFSGGAAVAILLAERRHDIRSFRSIAGNLDHQKLHDIHGVSQLSGSLSTIEVAPAISNISQHHFAGGRDKIVPAEIARHFVEASGNSGCVNMTVIANVTHLEGWEDVWPRLQDIPLYCKP